MATLRRPTLLPDGTLRVYIPEEQQEQDFRSLSLDMLRAYVPESDQGRVLAHMSKRAARFARLHAA